MTSINNINENKVLIVGNISGYHQCEYIKNDRFYITDKTDDENYSDLVKSIISDLSLSAVIASFNINGNGNKKKAYSIQNDYSENCYLLITTEKDYNIITCFDNKKELMYWIKN